MLSIGSAICTGPAVCSIDSIIIDFIRWGGGGGGGQNFQHKAKTSKIFGGGGGGLQSLEPLTPMPLHMLSIHPVLSPSYFLAIVIRTSLLKQEGSA